MFQHGNIIIPCNQILLIDLGDIFKIFLHEFYQNKDISVRLLQMPETDSGYRFVFLTVNVKGIAQNRIQLYHKIFYNRFVLDFQ